VFFSWADVFQHLIVQLAQQTHLALSGPESRLPQSVVVLKRYCNMNIARREDHFDVILRYFTDEFVPSHSNVADRGRGPWIENTEKCNASICLIKKHNVLH